MRQMLIDCYLNYINDYLTVELFAEHNGLTVEQGEKLIYLAKSVYYSQHPEA